MPLVLVVDDEPDIRDLIRVNLEAEGHDVVVAADGAGALAAIRSARPDAILLDVMMPGLDGWAVLETLKRADPEIAAIPVVMVTAMTATEDRLRGGIEGALRYITKPFEIDDLVDAIDDVLDPRAGPEAEQRQRVRAEALAALARIERGEPFDRAPEPTVRLTRLEPLPREPALPRRVVEARARLPLLTARQRELLAHLAAGDTVLTAAAALGTSRSNAYRLLERSAAKLGLRDAKELQTCLREGRFGPPPWTAS